MSRRIPIAGPSITQLEIDYVSDAAANAWYERANMYHQRFEEAFTRYLGVRYAACLPSCTSAIHLSLLALGVGAGDEVIVPDVTWIASVAPVTYVGATPVFADIDPQSWCLSEESFAACVTPRTKAVIPVDLYGGMPEMPAIIDIARQYGIAVIEDAAEALGSALHGTRAGAFGDTGVFSFHGSKTLTTGEGGMFVTNDTAVYERVLFLRDHGRSPGDVQFFNTEVAWKYKMSSLQAALGLAQLERIDDLVDMKRRIFGWYKEALVDVAGVSLNAERPGLFNSVWMTTMVVDPALGLTKEQLMADLAAKGIDTRPFFHPLSSLPAYRDLPQAAAARQRNHHGYRISGHGINLPCALTITADDVAYVAEAVIAVLRAHGHRGL
jgi:perosamine synthetase